MATRKTRALREFIAEHISDRVYSASAKQVLKKLARKLGGSAPWGAE
jgi:hypothetical protein